MILEASDIGLTVGSKTLLDTVSLSIRSGSRTAVIGPNGAGKSTLLSLLAADLEPSRGRVRFDGVDVTQIGSRQLARIRAVLTQSHTTDIAFSVHRTVAMGRFPYRFASGNTPDHDERAIKNALDRLDLTDLAHRPVRTLSGGEQQRVAMARVLAQETPLVLLDEPTTALDIKHQVAVLSVIDELSERECSIVAVLHDLNLATRFDDVLVLANGSVAAHGHPADVLRSDVLTAIYDHPIDVIGHPTEPGFIVLPRR